MGPPGATMFDNPMTSLNDTTADTSLQVLLENLLHQQLTMIQDADKLVKTAPVSL